MRNFLARGAAVGAVALLALGTAACSEREGATGTGSTGSTSSTGSEKGFAANALIGVALPSKTSKNWVLAGDLFTKGLKEAGFQADVQYAGASGTVADQQAQISSMTAKGAKVIVISATDAAQLSRQAETAQAGGAKIIAFERLITDTAAVDYYIAYDNAKVGELQGRALLDGMKARKPTGPWTIELFAGSSDDNNSKVFFDGAMNVLRPLIASKELIVGSGQVDIRQANTEDWKAENAERRMDSLLTSHYAGNKAPDGVLSPNDTLARAIIQSAESAGRQIPVVTGQDSEAESVKSIVAGKQYCTINKDTRKLVTDTIAMVKALQTGAEPAVNDTTSYNNGTKVVPAQLLPPLTVTKANVVEAYANDPKLAPLTKG